MTVQDVDEALLDTVCSRLRAHLSGDEAKQAEAFARQYYRWVAPEDIAERSELDVYGAALAHFDLARTTSSTSLIISIMKTTSRYRPWAISG